MSTKQSIKYAPGYHLYQDCLDDEPAPVYLQLHGVEVELKTIESGASITVTIPNETAVALGMLPRPNTVGQQEVDCGRSSGQECSDEPITEQKWNVWIDPESKDRCAYVDCDGKAVAHVFADDVSDRDRNAALIAAAPELLAHGWGLRKWEARKGYAATDEAVENSASETLWCSPHCVPERGLQEALF